MNMKKVLAMMLAVLMIVTATVAGTVAWLTVTSGTVTNTFTTGDINIELKEHKYENGALTTEEVVANDTYKVVPGATEPKDPFVRVKADSEKCYVYVYIENNVQLDDGTVVASYNINDAEWEKIAENGAKALYRFKAIVDASAEDKTCQVFSQVTYDGNKITKENIEQVEDDTIVVQAFAHQSDYIDDVTVADAAAKAQFSF